MNKTNLKKILTNELNLKEAVHWKLNPSTNRIDVFVDIDLSVLKKHSKISDSFFDFDLKFGVAGGEFICSNLGLKNLNFAPNEVVGDFDCSNNQLESLIGGPKYVQGSYNCQRNRLKSLKGGPTIVYTDFNCSENELKSLEYAPKITIGMQHYNNNKLKLLHSFPYIHNGIDLSHNKLTSIKSLNKLYFSGPIYLDFNELKNLSGAPNHVTSDFSCRENNKLKSLKFCPEIIDGNFFYGNDTKVYSRRILPEKIRGEIISSGLAFKLIELLKPKEKEEKMFLEAFNKSDLIIKDPLKVTKYVLFESKLKELFSDYTWERIKSLKIKFDFMVFK